MKDLTGSSGLSVLTKKPRQRDDRLYREMDTAKVLSS